MDSQQERMKSELESFINKGLAEGRVGWPARMSAEAGRRDQFTVCAEVSGLQRPITSPSDSSIVRSLLLLR